MNNNYNKTKECKILLLLSLLNWTEKKWQEDQSSLLKQVDYCWLFKRPVYIIIYLCSIFISHSSNDNLPHCPLHIISAFDWFSPKHFKAPLCDNVCYIGQCLSNGRKIMCLRFSNLLSFLPFFRSSLFLARPMKIRFPASYCVYVIVDLKFDWCAFARLQVDFSSC
jgi:hypothetical protein